jgi:GrpB-like predicted nucleotidyltransferase (UPF0157 family)
MQRVIVVPYDSSWPAEFARESAAVASALGESCLIVHHIGSTSIHGMVAKPIIDMLPVVRSIEAVDARSGEMTALGYEVLGEFGIPGRRYFRKEDSHGIRTHQVHVFEAGSPQIARHLAFRDFMRKHSDHAREYAALKQHLAAQFPNDIEAYMDGKDAFIRRIDAITAGFKAIDSRH